MSRRASRKRSPVPTAPVAARTDRLLIAVVLFYVAVLTAMVVSNHYIFLAKSLIVPVLLMTAVVSGRFKRFINDWALFLGGVVFFDFCRGLAFAVTTHFRLPMYLGYTLAWERWLCGGAVAPVRLQQWRAGLANPRWWDTFFILVYSSHYVFFLLFGLVIWYTRRQAFRAYTLALAGVMYAGLVIFFLAPTIPPWVAADEFLVLPPIEHLVRSFYNLHMPELLAAFDINPIAAMPSLHAAMPAICALLALRYFGRRGVVVLVYALSVCVAVIYLGEHYLVDVLAGWLLAVAVDTAVHHWGAATNAAAPARLQESAEGWQLRPIGAALFLIAATVGCGQLSAAWMDPLPPLPITRAFVERELLGRSALAHYYLGRLAFADGDFTQATTELTRALGEFSAPEQLQVIREFLGASAFRSHDCAAAIAALEPLRTATTDVDNLVLLGNAYVQSHRDEDGLTVLRDARRRFPNRPEPLYWLTRYRYLSGEIDRGDVRRVIDALREFPRQQAEPLRSALEEVLRTDRAALRH